MTNNTDMQPFSPTHKGVMFGVVPVLIDFSDPECPAVEVRGKGVAKLLLEIWMDIVEGGVGIFCSLAQRINPEFIPAFELVVTGELSTKGEV